MKQIRVALSIVLVVGAILIGVQHLWVVPIANPCNSFVEEYAPNRTPNLKQTGNEWELTISFTPAEDAEASRIDHATWLGERTFEVSLTGRRFRASSSNGYFIIRVNSEDESRRVLKDLCFK